MKWDIDKALARLIGNPLATTSLSRVMLSIQGAVEEKLAPLTAEESAAKLIMAWRLRVGFQDHNLDAYGRTIHGAYLKARRAIQGMTPEAAEFCGLRPARRRGKPMKG